MLDLLFNRYRNLSWLLLVVVSQIFLIAYQVRTRDDIRLIRVWAVTAVTQLANGAEFLRRNTIGFVEDYFVLINVRVKNELLTADNGKLKRENQYLKDQLQFAGRVEALKEWQTRTPSTTLVSRVIGTGTSTDSSSVYIDKGQSTGVQRGMAVVVPDGILGKVVAVYPSASLVMLLTDPNFRAGVISQKNRVRGTLRGGEGYGRCKIEHVQNEEKVEIGEIFYTSGDDRIFPKGIPVGVVKVSTATDGKTERFVTVEPTGLQNSVEEVLVIIEGAHMGIPEAGTPPLSGPMHLQAPVPGVAESESQKTKTAALVTDADRLRERYQKLGAAEGHVYGAVGSKVPDFTQDPAKLAVKPAPTPTAAPPGAAVSPNPSAVRKATMGAAGVVPAVKKPPVDPQAEVRPE